MLNFIKYFFLNLPKKHFQLFGLALILQIAATLSQVFLLILSAFLLATAGTVTSIASLQLLIVGVRFFGISRAVFRYLEKLASHLFTLTALKDFRANVFSKIEPYAPAIFSRFNNSRIFSDLMHNSEEIDNIYVRVLLPFMAGIFSLSIVSTVFYWLIPNFFLKLLLVQIVTSLIIPAIISIWFETKEQAYKNLNSELKVLLKDFFNLRDELIIYGEQQKFAQQITAKSLLIAQRSTTRAMLLNLENQAVYLGQGLTLAYACTYLANEVAANKINGILAAVIPIFSLAITEIFLQIPSQIHWFFITKRANSQINSLLHFEPCPVPKQGTTWVSLETFPKETSDTLSILEATDISFKYPEALSMTLENLSLQVFKGEKIWLKANSGKGKSTLCKLCLGFWETQKGQLRLGENSWGNDFKNNTNFNLLREELMFVSGSDYIFTDSILHNVTNTCPEVSLEKLRTVLSELDLEKILAKLPYGYETIIDKNSSILSGGEKQLLLFARVLFKTPKILILDEVFSHLDALKKSKLYSLIESNFAETTVIFISHEPPDRNIFTRVIEI